MKKITLIFVFLMMSAVAFTAAAGTYIRGDVNNDSVVNISDVTTLIDYVLSGDASSIDLVNADCTVDGTANISDVTCLIDYIMHGMWSETAHEWVDLGLVNRTLWATCNMGASNPEEYGYYYAWGETAPKAYYDWSTYKWCKGSENTLTKYCALSNYGYNGFSDFKSELDPEDDAAYVNWGTSWRVPTTTQLQELINECTWEWTTRNGVNGYLVTGPNGKTLFFPAAGDREGGSLSDARSIGSYWSRGLYFYGPYRAYNLFFQSGTMFLGISYRYVGLNLRAVRVSQN